MKILNAICRKNLRTLINNCDISNPDLGTGTVVKDQSIYTRVSTHYTRDSGPEYSIQSRVHTAKNCDKAYLEYRIGRIMRASILYGTREFNRIE